MAENDPFDDIFSDGLSGFQEPMQHGDWEAMSTLLDQESSQSKEGWMQKRVKGFWLLAIPLAFLSGLMIYPFLFKPNSIQNRQTSNPTQWKGHQEMKVIYKDTCTSNHTEVKYIYIPVTEKSPLKYSVSPSNILITPKQSNLLMVENGRSVKSDVNKKREDIDSLYIITDTLISAINSPVQSDSSWVKKDTFFSHGNANYRKPVTSSKLPTLGIHYTNEMPISSMDTTEWNPGHGMMAQVYTPDLLNSKKWAFYAGTRLGLTYHNKSQSFPVLLSTPSLDSGITYLRLTNFRWDMMTKLEYKGVRNFVPYIEAGLGLRAFSVQQQIKPNTPIPGYQSQSSEFFSDATYIISLNTGVRIPLGSGISADASIGYSSGPSLQTMAVSQSNLQNGTFQAPKYQVKPEFFQIKLGFLFELQKSKNPGISIFQGPSIPVPDRMPIQIQKPLH